MKKLIFFIIVIVLIPYIIVMLNKEDNLIVKYMKKNELLVKVKLENNNIIKIPFEEYIVGVVASEMPVEFEDDALKAQAIASRSYVLKKIETNKNNEYDIEASYMDQVYKSNDELKKKWLNNYDKYYKKIKNAVDKTKGEYLTYNGKVIDALFFSTSSGNTENSEDVFTSNLPYLRSVSSPWDNSSPVFKNTLTFTKEEFYTNLGISYNENPNIDIIEKSNTGHVKKIKVDNNIFKGTDFRKLLNLKSTYLEIEIKNNKIVINTQGNGHGVGMSQYGANYMARDGYNYKDILKHYYKNVEISKMDV